MPRRKSLQEAAGKIVATLEQRSTVLRAELLDMKVRQAEIEAELETIDAAPRRLDAFDPEAAGHPRCPHCWITEETRSILQPAPDIGRGNRYLCATCGFEIALPE